MYTLQVGRPLRMIEAMQMHSPTFTCGTRSEGYKPVTLESTAISRQKAK